MRRSDAGSATTISNVAGTASNLSRYRRRRFARLTAPHARRCTAPHARRPDVARGQRAPPPRGLETILESAQCEIEGLHDVVRQQMHVQGVLENERSTVLEVSEHAHRAAR